MFVVQFFLADSRLQQISIVMDSALELLDDHLFDGIYWKLFPITSNETVDAYSSALPRNNDLRIILSLFTFITVGGWFFYLASACFSYFVFFDHETMKHPKFLKNQVRQEIECAVKAMPVMSGWLNRIKKSGECSITIT